MSGTLLSLSGNLQFIDNQNHDDGPSGILYVTSFAQVLLNPGVSVSFINNTGRYVGITFRVTYTASHHPLLRCILLHCISSPLVCSLSCREGGAIVVKSSRVSSGFAQTLYNPQCFLQFSESQVAPIEWANYNVSEPNG